MGEGPLRPLRVALLQLPLQEADFFYSGANVPLAAAYLSAYLQLHAPGIAEIRVPPPSLQNQGGDSAILRWIREGDFDVVGFTLYLWNRDRSLHLALNVRAAHPSCILVAGGPEVANPERLEVFDAVFEGEGEGLFLRFLRDVREGRFPPHPPGPHRYRSESPLDLREVPNPYLAGALPVGPEAPLYLETLRGCPRRCAYCFYGKAFDRVRHFPVERLRTLFALASERGAREVYLMDPSFNLGGERELLERVGLIETLNTGRVPLHTELVLETVSKEAALLMRQAGFISVEVGLQSTNPAALRAVRRSLDAGRFRRGARFLQEQGILIRTGVILGLPEDSLETFRRTLDFVEELGLEKDLEVYPLSLLPGTELREQAGERGIVYMDRPPYWVLSTPTFSPEELYQAVAELEDRYGIEYQRPILPLFSNDGPFLTYVDLREEAQRKLLRERPERLSWNLTLSLSTLQLGQPDERARLLELARRLFQSNPYGYFKVVVHDEAPREYPLTSSAARRALEELALELFLPTHYGNLSRTYVEDEQGRFTVRLFARTEDPKTKRILEETGEWDLWEGEPPANKLGGTH